MNVAIRTRLDAIDAQMAELQKEQAKLREKLDKPEFVPGWYISWDGDEPTDKETGASIDYCKDADTRDDVADSWEHSTPFTLELAVRFFKKTRYDWAKIVKEHPEAKWASTDKSGRVDIWAENPNCHTKEWFGNPLSVGGYEYTGETPDWRNSLEARPEGI